MTPEEQNIADDKMRAEIATLLAETSAIRRETDWYVEIVAAVKLFFLRVRSAYGPVECVNLGIIAQDNGSTNRQEIGDC